MLLEVWLRFWVRDLSANEFLEKRKIKCDVVPVYNINAYREHWNEPWGSSLPAELHLDGHEAAVELLALVDLPDEEVAVASVHFRVGDVDHVLVDVEIDLKTREAIKKPPTEKN